MTQYWRFYRTLVCHTFSLALVCNIFLGITLPQHFLMSLASDVFLPFHLSFFLFFPENLPCGNYNSRTPTPVFIIIQWSNNNSYASRCIDLLNKYVNRNYWVHRACHKGSPTSCSTALNYVNYPHTNCPIGLNKDAWASEDFLVGIPNWNQCTI